MTNPVPTAPAPKGGMPKWLVILLVILLVIILGCCGGVATCFFFVRKAAQNAPAWVKEQAAKQGIEFNTPDASGVAIMPSNFPPDFPTYTGAKTILSTANTKENSGEATQTTSDAVADVKAFYDKQMADQGWKEESSTTNDDNQSLSYSKEKRTATVQISRGGNTTTIVLVYGGK